MAYIPDGAEWYVATLVEEITVEGDKRNVVHKNLVLVQAASPEEAYDRAVALGKEHEVSYVNPDSKLVRIKFRGLGDLNVVHEELKHGTELVYEERIAVPEDAIKAWIVPKDELSVFGSNQQSLGPDYSSQEILSETKRLLED